MTKKARLSSASSDADGVQLRLPPDLIQRIALFLGDAPAFFNYLDAFQDTPSSLGSLQHLWVASFHAPFHMLWPELHVDEISAARVAHLHTDRTYFRTIHVHAVFDLDLLAGCVSTTTSLSFHTCPVENEVSMPLDAWYRQLAALPIAHLTWLKGTLTGIPHSLDVLLPVLPLLPLLTSLDVNSACFSSPDALFAFVRDSKLTRLSIRNMLTQQGNTYSAPTTLTRPALAALTHWLSTQPVQVFSLGKWTMLAHAKMLSQLYDAIWSCPTLHTFHADYQHFPHLETYVFPAAPLHIQRLNLTSCGITVAAAGNLAQALADSKVTWLNLSNNPIGAGGAHALAVHALRRSKLRHLLLNHSRVGDLGCSHLAHALAESALVELSLDGNDLTDTSVLFLGYVLQTAPTTTSVSLRANAISITSAAALVRSLGMRSCETAAVDLDDNPIDEVDQDMLETMVAKEQMLRNCAFSCTSRFTGDE
ncbi:Aste57867_21484 [Aphanomyces stellatus]|uniref:Aste57867_21484 protein n=1 Tax=Aphanomyces stellatus TaxID=120398 RepID=A0A485LMG9_9STRA|nr:hypothetical protein As57867_021415 [Aphanomyces stellatus]VFT98154.1 Aste57867_21484 [Aphanomyces stellatus]